MKTIIKISLLFLLINFPIYSQSGWYEQILPVSGTISDMQFIDAQTGWITMFSPTNLIKTENGGKNWTILQSGTDQFEHFEFLNDTIGYATGHLGSSGQVSKTTNGGINWTLQYTGSNYYSNLSFLNNDTGYFCGTDGSTAGIWRTINGGANIVRIFTSTFFTIEQVFFLKQRYNNEFYGWWLSSGFISKTTNSGFNWSTPTRMINGENGNFNSLYFLDKDTGWVSFDPNIGDFRIFRTNNGGVNWVLQNESTQGVGSIYFNNMNKGWAGYSPSKIFATTNGGLNWGSQTSPIVNNSFLTFVDTVVGGTGYTRLAHTTDGGGIITYVGIDPISSQIPSSFKLEQNYPNPFNPQTTIKFSVLKESNISLTLYDITGKEILKVYDNERLSSGNYKVELDFSRKSLTSGAYFYSLKVFDNSSGLLFNESKKMVYVK